MSRRSSVPVLLALVCVFGGAFSADAQDAPRLGISAAKDHYLDAIIVPDREEFTIYVGAYGAEGGTPLVQPVSILRWVLHQACCGASLEVLDIAYNPELDHEGNPLAGVTSSSSACLEGESVWLATLRVRLLAPGAGDYVWTAGPFGWSEDCEGGQPVFHGMHLVITVPGTTDNPRVSWGSLRAQYHTP